MTVTTHRPHIKIPPWMGVIIIIMAVATTGMFAWSTYQQRQCNEAFARNFEVRVQWNQEDRDALQQLVTSVFENDRDRVQFHAYERWLQVTARNDRRRAAVPLPPLGECD